MSPCPKSGLSVGILFFAERTGVSRVMDRSGRFDGGGGGGRSGFRHSQRERRERNGGIKESKSGTRGKGRPRPCKT